MAVTADEFTARLRSLIAETINQHSIPLDTMICEVGIAHHKLIQTKCNIEAAVAAQQAVSKIYTPNGRPANPRQG